MASSNPLTGFSQPDDYGMEVLCASWNPVVTAAVEPVGQACHNLPAIDADAFLTQFYLCQKS